jgi:hypothetical protein
MSDSAAALLSTFLLSHKLDQAVVNYVLADVALGLGCESLSDFPGYFTAEDCDFRRAILAHVDKFKENNNAAKIQLSRLRIVWGAACTATSKASSTPPPADLEAPLSLDEARAQESMWSSVGGFAFHPSIEPAQHLINKCFR